MIHCLQNINGIHCLRAARSKITAGAGSQVKPFSALRGAVEMTSYESKGYY